MVVSKKNRMSANTIRRKLSHFRTISGQHLIMRTTRTSGSEQIVTVIVSVRTAPKATQRNTLRRTVSEIIRKLIPRTREGYHCMVTITTPTLPPHKALQNEVVVLMKKSAILDQ